MKVTVIPVVIGALGAVLKGLVKRLKEQDIEGSAETIQTSALQRSTRDQNTEKSPWDLKRLAVTQTLVKDYQLM